MYLAEQPPLTQSTLLQISDSLHIPRAFLSKILQQLARAGIVRSTKGPSGGFTLRIQPEDLTLERIVIELEGPIRVFECFNDGSCNMAQDCQILATFDRVSLGIQQTLASVTLADILPPSRDSAPAVEHAKH